MSDRDHHNDYNDEVEFDKDIDINIDFNFDSDVDIKLDKDVDINVYIDVDPDIKGNTATLTFSVEAVGKDTFAEADVHVLAVEDMLSSVDGVLIAAVD